MTVIGASRSPEKVGAIVLKNILDSGFTGKVYPVNPNVDNINNLTCYKDIAALPEVPDMVAVALPASIVLDTLNQIGAKGIKNVVVFSAGFKETGPDGAQLEKEMVEICAKFELNLLGPNCLGFVNNNCPINVTFGQLVKQSGNLRFISQSGAIAASLFDWCDSTGLGFSQFVTLGNKAVLSENDVLEYYRNTPGDTLPGGGSSVRPIGLYLESITEGSQFLRITSQLTETDPVFIIKPGKSAAAARAMQSHTGAIAGEDYVLEAALHQAGVIRCQSLEDFFDFSRSFAWENAPAGPRVAVISNAGGMAVISADAVVSEGLELAQFDEQTRLKLEEVLPRSASILDPVDVLGDALADRYGQAADIILANDQAQALVCILTPQVMTQVGKTATVLGELSKKYRKPILCSFVGGSLIAEGEQKLNEYKIPSFRFPERAIKSLGTMWRFREKQDRQQATVNSEGVIFQPDREKIKGIIWPAVQAYQKTLDNFQANELITAAGIPAPATAVADDFEQAKAFAQSNGWPVVLKLSSPGLLHKKDLGGVVVDIRNDEQMEDAWDTLERNITHLETNLQSQVKIQVQKDIVRGVEVIVGVKHDPTFGRVLLFGAGGSLAELIADRNLHLLPLEVSDAVTLIEESKIYTVLQGHGSEPPLAVDKLAAVLYRLGKVAELLPEVSEIEINPVIVTLNDVWAVDAKVILEQGAGQPAPAPQFQVAVTLSNTVLAGTFHYLEFTPEKPLNVKPGQYISVKVASNRINSYSVAHIDGEGKFCLLVDVKPGGPGSNFFEVLKPGDKITYLGPFGVFILEPDDGAKQLLFLGTGSGLSPLRRQIESALLEHHMRVPITLYIGLNVVEDIFWQDWLDKMSQDFSNFQYKIVIWKPNEGWRGENGFITDVLSRDVPDAGGVSAYLCGNKNMITGAIDILQLRGCPKERIYTEKF